MNRTRPVLVVQHVACEGPGAIAQSLDVAEIGIDTVRGFEGEHVRQDIGDYAGLVVMGGPMGVGEQEQYPFLKDELRLIESALSANMPILGICLGSQLLATALGATVQQGARREIGWHRVSLTDAAAKDSLWRDLPPEFTPLHWHGDVFDVPPGAVCLASSKLTECQCFRAGDRAYGCLFHLELDIETIEALAAVSEVELADAHVDAAQLLAESAARLLEVRPIGKTVFSRWAELVQSS